MAASISVLTMPPSASTTSPTPPWPPTARRTATRLSPGTTSSSTPTGCPLRRVPRRLHRRPEEVAAPHPQAWGFRGFADAGRKLSDLHLSYETVSPYAGIVEEVKGTTSATPA